ncbi:signal recognition particle 14 kda [Lasius niger]|uniref:Signal recognition particle 14 kDa protein n=1 Tax=Lasius niger TaxID=67767 RepID=A0A0J7L9S3_LASNI|nr:signal recognition particle 14 kda [Lasius niger]
MVLLENDAFLAELTKLFEKSRLSGAVSLTIKRFNGHNKPVPRKGRPSLPTPTEYLCLVRASFRNKKISTVVYSFQRCKQIPTGILESFEDKYKWAEEAEEDKVSEAKGSLT